MKGSMMENAVQNKGSALARPPLGLTERRDRTRVSLEADCRVEGQGFCHRMRIENVSSTGVLLRCATLKGIMKRGLPLTIHCQLGGDALRAEGTVARVEYFPGKVLIGVGHLTWYRVDV